MSLLQHNSVEEGFPLCTRSYRHPILTRRVGVPTRGAFPSSFRVLFDAMRRDVPLRRVFPFSMRRISPPRRVTLYLTRREGISPRCVVFYLGERHGHAMYAHLYFFLSFFLTRMTAGTTTRGYYPPHTIANTTPSPPSTFHRHPHHHQRQCQCRPRRPHHHEKGHPFLARKDTSVCCLSCSSSSCEHDETAFEGVLSCSSPFRTLRVTKRRPMEVSFRCSSS